MSKPLLSILITSLPERVHTYLWPLWEKLSAQVAASAVAGQVEILVFIDNRQRTIGEKRDDLVQMSRGDFVAFVDDDDDVAPAYVAALLAAITRHPEVDVVTFQQLAIINGVQGICTFGLGNPNEQFSPQGFRRSAWHVCAWRGAIARRFRFPATNQGEDWAWARHLVADAQTSCHIDQILHTYRYDPKVSAATPGVVPGDRFTWRDIPGWFDFPDLYRERVQQASPGAVFVELGTWLGKSTAFMLSSIQESGKAIRFTSYDTFKGSVTEPEHQAIVAEHGGSLLAAARSNLARACGPDGPTCLVEADSVAAARLHADASVDFCFIDADHTEAGVIRDIEAWLPKMKPGGVIAGHDYDSPAVAKAVDGLLGPVYHVRRTSARCWLVTIPEDIGGL